MTVWQIIEARPNAAGFLDGSDKQGKGPFQEFANDGTIHGRSQKND
jgi:hypothetical protein